MTRNTLNLKFSRATRNFLSKFYKDIHHPNINHQLPPPILNKANTQSVTKSFNRNAIKPLSYMSPQIKKEAEKLTELTTLDFNNNRLNIFSKPKPNNLELIKNLTNTINTVKAYTKNSKPTQITIYLTDAKKRFPLNHHKHSVKPLGPNEINSGSTYITQSDELNGPVTIWREDELMRVTIHELLHSLKSDYNLFNTPHLDNLTLETYSINNDNNINLNEAYNELNALIFTTAMSAKTEKQFLKNLQYEHLNSIKQASTVMQHQNRLHNLHPNTSPDWLFNPNSEQKFQQKTNVFSYYIAKTALLNNFNSYINFITKNKQLSSQYPIFPPSETLKNSFHTLTTNSISQFRPILTKLIQNRPYPPKNTKDLSLNMTITGLY